MLPRLETLGGFMKHVVIALAFGFGLILSAENSNQNQPSDDFDQVYQHLQSTILERLKAGEAMDAPQRIQAALKLISDLKTSNRFSEAGLEKTAKHLNGRLQEIASTLILLEASRCGVEITSRADATQTQSLELTASALSKAGAFRLMTGNDGKYSLAEGPVDNLSTIDIKISRETNGLYRMSVSGQESSYNQQRSEIAAEAQAAALKDMMLTAFGSQSLFRVTCIAK